MRWEALVKLPIFSIGQYMGVISMPLPVTKASQSSKLSFSKGHANITDLSSVFEPNNCATSPFLAIQAQ